MTSAPKSATAPVLPKGIKAGDLKYPKKAPWSSGNFELWYTGGMGWVIPTLQISSGSRSAYGKRTYAVVVSTGQVCRVGMGPHVHAKHVVYVTTKSADRLAPFLALREQGQADAGQVRDRISTRRAQGQMHRAAGHTSWRW